MIITRGWLQEWLDVSKISSEKITQTLNSIGLEVDSYEEVRIPEKVVIGYVKSKRKHEDSDKLSVCEVDVANEVLQIVCGAKNVEAGQYVAVSLVGAKLPNGLVIKPAKLRGVQSNGMICSSTELGLAKINEGIMVLDSSIGDLVLGRELKEYPALNDDIIEIELTPNRGDCLSIYGVARDLSAAFDLPIKEVVYSEQDGLLGIGRVLSVRSNDITDSSFQYRAFGIKGNFKIDLVKSLRMSVAGIAKECPIDSLLSYTTYSTGVLLRAYDGDKISKDGAKITFDIHKEKHGNCAIYYDKECLSLAGISQNDLARVCKSSKTIIIEASYTDPKVIAVATNEDKSLKGDEQIYRSSRGSEPNLSLGGDYIFNILSKMSDVSLYSGSQQLLINKEAKIVSFSIDEMNAIIGHDVPRNDAVKILKKLGFDVSLEQELINVKIPAFRHDIENVYDIAEEVVRIVGIDNIPSKPLVFSEKNRLNESFYNYKNRRVIRIKAAGSGFFECVHYVFDNEADLLNLGFKKCKVSILNPINSELSVFRPTLINHFLHSCERNIKNSRKSVKLFEIGTVFDENANESDNVAFLASGFINDASLLNGAKPKEVDFIYFASKVQAVIGKFKCEIPKEKIPYLSEFEQANVVQNGKVVGYIGRVDLGLEAKLDLPKTYVCELKFKELKFDDIVAKSYSKFPSISRDLSLIVPQDMRYEKVRECISLLDIKNLKSFSVVDIYTDKSLENHSSITIKFTFQDMEKTLEDADITGAIELILKELKEKLNIGIR
ncbi:phenylalanine--tRNA ligase subunit beta [Campylobacter geochelonis]|uniref:phenylalanine--tRNA ligase subunit beta n=1 Tax=Campylobacter geochelonis TaxID=1780362 RepID=UPI00077074BE|nr:phenylalanine--tRNA ligase subunit beta [Campylobacter geochelonis]CZE49054.1 phenylalanyl-tRNA synthetase subunit beta [Campylobacter geochelonis]